MGPKNCRKMEKLKSVFYLKSGWKTVAKNSLHEVRNDRDTISNERVEPSDTGIDRSNFIPRNECKFYPN